ncbi:MAG: prepilin-type N-terminal cleavage/methylation domain-containing protein [Bifidobacteriaceae bacterium]|jgi:prepilin-type N-terminal cleavage/methylation domain-containing protein|nr:prepilin-type N-terminal cleavage/methylation domain-containing protein [Bifidobacteriaceae bacterium]
MSGYRKARTGDRPDEGMTLAELVTVIAIGSIVLSMALVVTVSLAKHNGKNLVRQERADATRQVSIWLTDALAYSAPQPNDPAGASPFEVAEERKMVFLSALPAVSPDHGAVSRVTLVLDEECWSGDPDPGVLHRCLERSQKGPDGSTSFCASGCPADLYEDFVVARNVKGGPVFSYALQTDAGTTDVPAVPDPVQLPQIVAVEFNVTVGGEPGSGDEDVEATVVKRHSVKGWSRL